MATTANFSVYAGDSEPLQMGLTGYDNITAVDLTDVAEIVVLFKRVLADPDRVARIAKRLSDDPPGVKVIDASHGLIEVDLLPSDTNGVMAQLQLEYMAKAFFADPLDPGRIAAEITGAKGTLTIGASDVQQTQFPLP